MLARRLLPLCCNNEALYRHGAVAMKRHRTTHRKNRQLNLRWIMAAALILTGFFAWRTWTSTQQNQPARVDQESQTNPILPQSRGGRSSRAVFPYSVIPGGVGSVAELKY